MFTKGNKLGKGRLVGSRNNPDLNSLRKLLEESFSENRPWIKECIRLMLTNIKSQMTILNDAITKEKDATQIGFYARQRSSLLEEFKWMLTLKATLEPKEVNADIKVSHSVEDLLATVSTAERLANVSIN